MGWHDSKFIWASFLDSARYNLFLENDYDQSLPFISFFFPLIPNYTFPTKFGQIDPIIDQKEDQNYNILNPQHINRRGIYKDSVDSSLGYSDYQFRPNQFVAMVVVSGSYGLLVWVTNFLYLSTPWQIGPYFF